MRAEITFARTGSAVTDRRYKCNLIHPFFARGAKSSLIMRAIWKGSISFGLVNIPIALYPATRKEELKFRLLRKGDLSPVNYKRVAEKDGKEVPWDENRQRLRVREREIRRAKGGGF